MHNFNMDNWMMLFFKMGREKGGGKDEEEEYGQEDILQMHIR